MREHVRVVGMALIIYHALIALFAILFSVVATRIITEGNPRAFLVYGWPFLAITLVVILLVIPGVVAGIGVLKFRRWARVLAIIVGAINLISFPVGTLIGIYTLWVLLHKDTLPLFR